MLSTEILLTSEKQNIGKFLKKRKYASHNGFERLKIGKKHMRHFIFHDDIKLRHTSWSRKNFIWKHQKIL